MRRTLFLVICCAAGCSRDPVTPSVASPAASEPATKAPILVKRLEWKPSACFEAIRKGAHGLPERSKRFATDHLWGAAELWTKASEKDASHRTGRRERLNGWQPENAASAVEETHANVRKLVNDSGADLLSDTGLLKDNTKDAERKIRVLRFELTYRQDGKDGAVNAELWLIVPELPPKTATKSDYHFFLETVERETKK